MNKGNKHGDVDGELSPGTGNDCDQAISVPHGENGGTTRKLKTKTITSS